MKNIFLHVFLLIAIVAAVSSMPIPDDDHHVHIKIHVPKHFHTHHHTVLKKIYVPVKEKHHEEHVIHKEHDEGKKYFDDAWK